MSRRDGLYVAAGGCLVGLGLLGLAWEMMIRGTKKLEERASELWREAYF